MNVQSGDGPQQTSGIIAIPCWRDDCGCSITVQWQGTVASPDEPVELAFQSAIEGLDDSGWTVLVAEPPSASTFECACHRGEVPW